MITRRRTVARVFGTVAALAAGTLLSGCAPSGEDGPASTADAPPGAESADSAAGAESKLRDSRLAGTAWMLVELQSMDDAIGTTRPRDASRYTLLLHEDSTAEVRLDCNRATGSWKAQPSADPSNGSFEFGPLATTDSLCAPPDLDERIAAQLPYVRGYLVRDGRLYLSLMADGGILAWRPHEDHDFRTEPDDRLEQAIREAAPDYTVEVVGAGEDRKRARYVHGSVDLDGDGTDEVFAYMLGPFFCGTGGCTLFLFRDAGNRFELIADFPISRTPIIVSPRESEGWKDIVRLESGGGMPASYLRHRFDGSRYVEAERTPADGGPPEGIPVLTGDLSFEKGILLEPRDTSD